MKRSLRILILLVLVPLIDIAGTAQEPDARTILQAALKAMGGENLRSIQYPATRDTSPQSVRPTIRRLTGRRPELPPTRGRSTTRRDPHERSTG